MKAYLRSISLLTVTIVLWSCFGLGIGMIGHTMMQEDMVHAEMNGEQLTHECCGGATSQPDTDAQMQHHQKLYATVVKIVQLLVAAFVAYIGYGYALQVYRSIAAVHRYAVFWQQTISYFALYIRRLFQSGILHPKTF